MFKYHHSDTPVNSNEALALLKYMIHHNEHHNDELHQIAHSFNEETNELIHQACFQFEQANSLLLQALEKADKDQ